MCDSDLYMIVCHHAARDRESIQGNVAPGLHTHRPHRPAPDAYLIPTMPHITSIHTHMLDLITRLMRTHASRYIHTASRSSPPHVILHAFLHLEDNLLCRAHKLPGAAGFLPAELLRA